MRVLPPPPVVASFCNCKCAVGDPILLSRTPLERGGQGEVESPLKRLPYRSSVRVKDFARREKEKSCLKNMDLT